MKPIKLKLAAFEPYVEELTLDFEKYLQEQKMFLIHGETGAGKTSILDAICYALYGDSCGGDRKHSMLRCEQAGDKIETFVDFTFALGNKKYRILRKPKQTLKLKNKVREKDPMAELYFVDNEGNEILIEHRATFVTQKIEELIGFKSDQFRQVVFLPQGRFQRFLTAKSDDREKILKILFKTDFYERLESALEDKSKDRKKILDSINNKLKDIFENIKLSTEEELKTKIKESEEELKILTKEEEKLIKEKDTAQKKFMDGDKLNEKFVATNNKELEVKSAESNFALAKANYEKSKVEYELRKKEETRRQKLETDIKRLQRINEDSKNYQEKNEKLSLMKKEELEIEKKLKDTEQTLNKYEEALKKLKEDKEKLVIKSTKVNEYEERLKSCKRRDALKLELEIKTKELKSAEKEYQKRKDKFDELMNNQRDGSAAFLAKNLSEGKPCPVCGSTHHPQLAKSTIKVPTTEDLTKARDKSSEAQEALNKIQTLIKRNQDDLELMKDLVTTEVASEELKIAKKANEELNKYEMRIKNGENLTKSKKEEYEKIKKQREEKLRETSILQGEFNKQKEYIENELKELKLKIEELGDKLKEFETELNDLKDKWINAEREYNLASQKIGGASDVLKVKKEELTKLKEEIKGKKQPNIEELQKVAKESEEKLKQCTESLMIAKNNLAVYNEKYEKIKVMNEERIKVLGEYKIWSMLSDVACGKKVLGEGNKISFSRYALQSKLEKVVEAANQRLKIMSNGAFELRNKLSAKRKSSSAGLELEVYHAYHGTTRAVETLSGGESFLASLALAMGLADAVQNKYGGINLDTIFIDEGFGTLDNEKLKNAIQALMTLQEGGRLVGIISHVESLKRRISVRLEVTKNDIGSTAKFVE